MDQKAFDPSLYLQYKGLSVFCHLAWLAGEMMLTKTHILQQLLSTSGLLWVGSVQLDHPPSVERRHRLQGRIQSPDILTLRYPFLLGEQWTTLQVRCIKKKQMKTYSFVPQSISVGVRVLEEVFDAANFNQCLKQVFRVVLLQQLFGRREAQLGQ
jgi:hypothetical protein